MVRIVLYTHGSEHKVAKLYLPFCAHHHEGCEKTNTSIMPRQQPKPDNPFQGMGEAIENNWPNTRPILVPTTTLPNPGPINPGWESAIVPGE